MFTDLGCIDLEDENFLKNIASRRFAGMDDNLENENWNQFDFPEEDKIISKRQITALNEMPDYEDVDADDDIGNEKVTEINKEDHEGAFQYNIIVLLQLKQKFFSKIYFSRIRLVFTMIFAIEQRFLYTD